MYFVKYCFAAAYRCQSLSFFGHTIPAHIVTSCDKIGRGCRQKDEVILYCFNSAKSMLYTNPVAANITIIIKFFRFSLHPVLLSC